jgi:Holliday junction DNA helicase RuvA
MITTISGKLTEKKPTSLTVEVSGIGYALNVPLSTYDKVGTVGESVRLYTHLRVRDDAMELYGFATPEERSLFLLLMSVTGIGPKAALNILSSSRPAALHEAITGGDEDLLRSIPGIGKKMAGRLIVELREKLPLIPLPGVEPKPPGTGAGAKVFEDAVGALTSLGYTRSSAVKAVQKAQSATDPGIDLETLVRAALTHAQT